MENGEFGMSAGVAAKCPPEWLLALGGGSGGDLLDLECPDNLQRGTTGATARIMRGAKSERAGLLPPINGATARTLSLDAADSAGRGGAVGAHDADAMGRTGSSAEQAALPKKPEPFSIASLMENARRKAQEKKEEEAAKARGEVFQRVCSDDSMEATLREHAERQEALQAKLKNLSSSLKKFDMRAAEAKIEHERVRQQAMAESALMWRGLKGGRGGPAQPCAFDLAPPDMVLKILGFLSGKKLFLALMASRRFHCADREFWAELLLREHRERFAATHSSRDLKELYRDNEMRWSRLTATFAWLTKQGCPTDVHGKGEGPWSRVTMTLVLKDAVTYTAPGAAEWRREFLLLHVRCIMALLNSSNDGTSHFIYWKPLSCLGTIRPSSANDALDLNLWATFVSNTLGLEVPIVSSPPRHHNNPLATCGCKKHCMDFHGDHTSTCTAHSGATKAHDWMVGVLGLLFRTAGHTVRTQHGVTASAGQRRGDVELRSYLQDATGRRAWSSTCP